MIAAGVIVAFFVVTSDAVDWWRVCVELGRFFGGIFFVLFVLGLAVAVVAMALHADASRPVVAGVATLSVIIGLAWLGGVLTKFLIVSGAGACVGLVWLAFRSYRRSRVGNPEEEMDQVLR